MTSGLFQNKSGTHLLDASRQYDPETVRRIFARAAELEQHQKELLSAAQVEELGRELGFDPATVRRALGEIAPEKRSMDISAATDQKARRAPRTIGEELLRAMMPGFGFGALCGLLFYYYGGQILVPGFAIFHPGDFVLLALLLYCLPPIFAFWSGWRRRDWRLGALSGFFLVAAGFIGLTAGSLLCGLLPDGYLAPIINGSWMRDGLIAATLLGAAGGLLSKMGAVSEN